MPQPIDYYKYWNEKRMQKKPLEDREKKALKLISNLAKADFSFLELGCGNGEFMLEVKKIFPQIKIRGIDYSKKEVEEARKKFLNVKTGNFEESIEEKNSSFDFIYAGELIEHLYNPDLLLTESNRILKENGYLLLTTPNLCSWFNRIIMLLGIQPLFLEPSTKSKLVGAGFLKKFKKEPQPVGHVRIFTFSALKDILEMYGFKIINVNGAVFDTGFPKLLLHIDRLFNIYPKLSSNLIVLARKIKDINAPQ